jgi:glucose-1-phosphate cytidylyltransferase
VRPPSRFGELRIEKDKRVTEFNEKPQVSEGLINGGFFVCEREFFKYLSADAGCILEQEPLRRVAADGQLVAYEHHGFWQPMDTFREFELLSNLWQSGKAPWKIWK